ncbi:lipopolysaccharide biosynthesis protein [Mucilaginibacter boryungensis]|nr:oligosaccharide flippase family protein [Mucilaginibacter boryungensis]
MEIKPLFKNKQFLSLAGNVIMSMLNIITTSILYRHMAKEEIGVWFFFQTTFILIDTFRTGFLQTAFVKFYAGAQPERAENILGSTWYLGLLITGIVFLINIPAFFLLNYIDNLGIIEVIKWTTITFVSTLPIVMATWLLQAQARYAEILYIRAVNQASFIIFVITLILSKHITLNMVFITNVLSCLLTCIVIFSCRWSGFKSVTKQTRGSVKELFHFGKFSVGTSISANLLRSSDTFIINFTLGPGAIAIYNISQTLTNLIDIPLRSFVTTGMTSLAAAQNNNKKEEVEYIFKKYAGALTIIFIPVIIGGFIFADVAVSLIGGGKYVGTPAANIFRIFMIFAFFIPLDRFIGVTLDVIHKPKYNFYKVLIMLAINVVGDFAGIYFMHSIYGVGIASIPTFVFGTVIGYFSLKRFLNFDLTSIFKLGYTETRILIQTVRNKLGRTREI